MVAGHIGSPRQWRLFDDDWRDVLASEGVEEFHAKQLLQGSNWQSRKSPYHGWTIP
jgi:hypothetical protein